MQFLSLLRSRKITHKAFTGSGGRNAGLLISYNLHMNHEYFRTLRSQLDFFTTYWSDITALCWAESAPLGGWRGKHDPGVEEFQGD